MWRRIKRSSFIHSIGQIQKGVNCLEGVTSSGKHSVRNLNKIEIEFYETSNNNRGRRSVDRLFINDS